MESQKSFTGKKHNLESFLSSTEAKASKKRKTFTSSPESDSDSTHSKNPQINKYTGKPYSTRYYEILNKRKSLPAFEAKNNIIKLLDENQILIIQGETYVLCKMRS